MIANNAVKLQRARQLAIDRLIRALETMPDDGGGRLREQHNDKKSGKHITVDYDLPALVAALEKLSGGTLATKERQEQIAEDSQGVMMSYADLFSRAAPERTIESVEADTDDEDGEDDV